MYLLDTNHCKDKSILEVGDLAGYEKYRFEDDRQ